MAAVSVEHAIDSFPAVTTTPNRHRAHLLNDAKGPFGIQVDNEWDQQGGARLIVRPDRIDSLTEVPSLFHTLPRSGGRWADGRESVLANMLHDAMCHERGVLRGEMQGAEYRRHFFGLRKSARQITNRLLNELYAAAIPANRLRLIRRYPIRHRSEMYAGMCRDGERAWQLAEAFPVLAARLYGVCGAWWREEAPQESQARQMVKDGEKLSVIAETMGIPMSLRRLSPAVTRYFVTRLNGGLSMREFFLKHPHIASHHAPQTVPRQRAWLAAIAAASADEEFAAWVAIHWDQIAYWREAPDVVRDISDWVSAGIRERSVERLSEAELSRVREALSATGEPFIADSLSEWWRRSRNQVTAGRPFNPSMAPQTVLRLSQEWHDRTAQTQAADVPFPEPWYDGDTVDGYRIEPITNAGELTRYAYRLHNCASQYAHAIANGSAYLYIVRDGSTLLAMLELGQGERPQLRQLKGPCNRPVSKAVRAAVRKWLRQQQREHGAGRIPPRPLMAMPAGDGMDEPMPF